MAYADRIFNRISGCSALMSHTVNPIRKVLKLLTIDKLSQSPVVTSLTARRFHQSSASHCISIYCNSRGPKLFIAIVIHALSLKTTRSSISSNWVFFRFQWGYYPSLDHVGSFVARCQALHVPRRTAVETLKAEQELRRPLRHIT